MRHTHTHIRVETKKRVIISLDFCVCSELERECVRSRELEMRFAQMQSQLSAVAQSQIVALSRTLDEKLRRIEGCV
jgi:hypothetical protein